MDGVFLDAGFLLALASFVVEQITFYITKTHTKRAGQKKKKLLLNMTANLPQHFLTKC